MKYFTKEWYHDCQLTSLPFMLVESKEAETFSEEFYQKLYLQQLNETIAINRRIFEESNGERLFDAETVNEDFSLAQRHQISQWKRSLPPELLQKVADIRVLALKTATRQVIQAIRKFVQQKRKNMESVLKSYNSYYNKIKHKLGDFMDEEPNMHDCFITSVTYCGQNVILEFNNEGGFSDVNKIVLENGKITRMDYDLINAWWIYDEIYPQDNAFDLHVLMHVKTDNKYDFELNDVIFHATHMECFHDSRP